MRTRFEFSPTDRSRRAIALRLEIEEFHADYCAALDAGQVESWPDFFTEDGLYRVTARARTPTWACRSAWSIPRAAP